MMLFTSILCEIIVTHYAVEINILLVSYSTLNIKNKHNRTYSGMNSNNT